MSFNRFLFGDKDKISQQSLQTSGQQNFLSQMLQQLMGNQGGMGSQGSVGGNFQQSQNYLSNMLQGGPEAYSNWAKPYETQFQEQTLPGIAERFAGLGGGLGGGALGSSGFGQALGGAATQFQSNLAGLYAQLQQQAAQQAMGQYNQSANLGLGTRAFENIYQPGSTGALGGILSGAAQGLGAGFGMPLGSSFMGLFNQGAKK